MEALRAAIPKGWTVLVCANRGLYAKWLFARIGQMGWYPFLRINAQGWCREAGEATYHRLASVVSEAGTQWCSRVVCFKDNPLECTLLAFWDTGHSAAWLIVTNLPPAGACAQWYAVRAWIESGFAHLRGWQGHKTQMADGARAARMWMALAVATLWVVGVASVVARRRAVCGLGQCVGVSCFRLGWLQLSAAEVSGEPCWLAGLVGADWLVERSLLA